MGPIRLGFQFCGELVEEGPHRLDTPLVDIGDRHAVDSGGALVGGNLDPRSPHHVTAGELVVEDMEPAFWVLLGTAVEHTLERLEGVHTLGPADGPSRQSSIAALSAIG